VNLAMTPGDAGGTAAHGLMDDVDVRLLADIRAIFEAIDPMPPDLPDRIRFGLALRDLEVEMAWLAEEEDLALAVRGAEQNRTVTFDSDSLTVMIRIDVNRDGTAHLDGWLAPAQRREVEVKTAADSLSVASDEQGRFAFARVPRGVARLLFRPAARDPDESARDPDEPARDPDEPAGEPDPAARTVVTPALVL
jgi:hypothetical protein